MSAVFDRLIGLETEYAVRCRPPAGRARPTEAELFQTLMAVLRRKMPTAAAGSSSAQARTYLASGGAVYFQQTFFGAGLVEGCTPECRSPRQLVACQRAQDRLLEETARVASPGFCLLKNCRDSQGEMYGAQENYFVLLADGWRLRVWCRAWVPLRLLLLVQWILLLVIVLLGLLVVLTASGLLYLLLSKCLRLDEAGRRRWRDRLLGRGWVEEGAVGVLWPDWVGWPMMALTVLILAPTFLLASWLVGVTNMRRTQRRLLPFLASRAVLAGSGWLAPDGRFHLTEKAQTRRTLWTEVLPHYSRLLFSIDHFVKLAGPFKPRWEELLAPRQRLQLCLGDSNMCQEAEYLRVATTALVIDAIETGAITAPPQLHRPLGALRQISGDPTLTVAVRLRNGGRMTALEIQRWYLDACRRYLDGLPDPPEEAREVLRLWADVLDKLETDRAALVGRLDWVTKKFLLDEAGAGLPYPARKKIDLRYHELSPEGYFMRLQAEGLTCPVVSEDEIEQAMRMPPVTSPAWQRARYIREFSGGGLLSIGWRFLTVRTATGETTRIDLHQTKAEADKE